MVGETKKGHALRTRASWFCTKASRVLKFVWFPNGAVPPLRCSNPWVLVRTRCCSLLCSTDCGWQGSGGCWLNLKRCGWSGAVSRRCCGCLLKSTGPCCCEGDGGWCGWSGGALSRSYSMSTCSESSDGLTSPCSECGEGRCGWSGGAAPCRCSMSPCPEGGDSLTSPRSEGGDGLTSSCSELGDGPGGAVL